MPAPAIVTEQLTRIFGDQTAVDHIDLTAGAGAIFGVLGPMGAGKTTLVRLLLGLVPPTSGMARVLGCDVTAQADAIRARTGVVLQAPGLYDNLTALENLDLYARIWRLPSGDRTTRIRELLQHQDLWPRRNERVGDWSAGMKHKLAILRAVVHRPALLILDEPTAGLDAADQELLCADLAALAHLEGTTILLTTRDPAEAEMLCDEIAILSRGRVCAQGSPKVLARQAGSSSIVIKGARFSGELVQLLESRYDVRRAGMMGGTLTVEVSCAGACSSVVNLVVESGAEVESVERQNAGLAAVYRAILEGEHECGYAVR